MLSFSPKWACQCLERQPMVGSHIKMFENNCVAVLVIYFASDSTIRTERLGVVAISVLRVITRYLVYRLIRVYWAWLLRSQGAGMYRSEVMETDHNRLEIDARGLETVELTCTCTHSHLILLSPIEIARRPEQQPQGTGITLNIILWKVVSAFWSAEAPSNAGARTKCAHKTVLLTCEKYCFGPIGCQNRPITAKLCDNYKNHGLRLYFWVWGRCPMPRPLEKSCIFALFPKIPYSGCRCLDTSLGRCTDPQFSHSSARNASARFREPCISASGPCGIVFSTPESPSIEFPIPVRPLRTSYNNRLASGCGAFAPLLNSLGHSFLLLIYSSSFLNRWSS